MARMSGHERKYKMRVSICKEIPQNVGARAQAANDNDKVPRSVRIAASL